MLTAFRKVIKIEMNKSWYKRDVDIGLYFLYFVIFDFIYFKNIFKDKKRQLFCVRMAKYKPFFLKKLRAIASRKVW